MGETESLGALALEEGGLDSLPGCADCQLCDLGQVWGVRSEEGVRVPSPLPRAEGCSWTCEHLDWFRQPFVLCPIMDRFPTTIVCEPQR